MAVQVEVPAEATVGETGEVHDVSVAIDLDQLADLMEARRAPKKRKPLKPKDEKSGGYVMVWPSAWNSGLSTSQVVVLMRLARLMDSEGVVRFQLAEVAKLCGVTRQSAWRIIDGMVERGALRKADTGRYYVNPEMVWCGYLAERTIAKMKWDGHLGGTGE